MPSASVIVRETGGSSVGAGAEGRLGASRRCPDGRGAGGL